MILLLTLIFSFSAVSGIEGALEECPYTVTKEHKGWEEREYAALKWVSTQGWDVMPHDGPDHQKAFFRLFNYIDSNNSENLKIDMTAPVSYRVIPGTGPNCDSSTGLNCESNYTMSFFIPMSLQDNPPVPQDSSVYIEERPVLRVAARQFPGFPGDIDFSIQAAELYELAEQEGVALSDVPLWTANYDGPAVILNRRNEVWLELQ